MLKILLMIGAFFIWPAIYKLVYFAVQETKNSDSDKKDEFPVWGCISYLTVYTIAIIYEILYQI